MGKFFRLAIFLCLTPVVFLLLFVSISYLSYLKVFQDPYHVHLSQSQTVAYAALPSAQDIIEQEVIMQDARVEMIKQFFAKYKSPLEPYAKEVVNYADDFGLDFRLIPSIAMQESNLCLKAPVDSNNCWGFGIYGGKVRMFKDYKEGIYEVTKTLATNYKKNGLETPEQIMTRYTPGSNGSWARGVTHFMNQLQ
ncbi:MAG: hypothetical protein HYV37_03760 [Candidatus Levyibacteriota bacterium]|nr:MAG: hypothetical protein HYV37_03760 [Candidatus Levybacteria bacterium]